MIVFLRLFAHTLIAPFKTQARLGSRDRHTAASAERAASEAIVETEAVDR
jgi:hypothetical protein